MNILSLFDGMGCAYLAFKRANIPIGKYYASEIDKYAKSVAKYNIPEYIDLGDITKINFSKLKDIDFIIGGSPCQDLSIAKKNRQGLKGNKSCLFFKFVEALQIIKPKYYILENVSSMSVENINTISFILGSNPTEINSALVSAQNRKRLYWTSSFWQIPQPIDKGILLKDILEKNVSEKYYISDKLLKTFSKPSGKNKTFKSMKVKNKNDKAATLNSRYYKMGRGDNYVNSSQAKTGLYMIQTARGVNKGGIKAENGKTPSMTTSSWEGNNHLYNNGKIRKLTPVECERLQTVKDNFTKEPNISDTQRYRMLGNSFTVDVIAHIIKQLTKDKKCQI